MPIGTTLSNLRRQQGKTMADMEQSTKIMGRMLSALENERWDELPATVYVKGYIQNYAHSLGVDAAPLLEEFAADLGKTHAVHEPLKRIPERTVVPHHLDIHDIPKGAWMAVAAAVLVVALAVWGISALMSRDDTPTPIAPETTSTTLPNTGTGTTAVGEAGTGAATAGVFVLKVAVAEGQSSWLQVTVDSLVAYEGTLPGGESKMWTVTSDAVVRVAKPASVSVTRDGQPVEIPAAAADGISQVTLAAAAE